MVPGGKSTLFTLFTLFNVLEAGHSKPDQCSDRAFHDIVSGSYLVNFLHLFYSATLKNL